MLKIKVREKRNKEGKQTKKLDTKEMSCVAI